MNSPEIGPAYAPEIEISKKFRKNFLMSFPGFANNGYNIALQNFYLRSLLIEKRRQF